MPRTTDDEAFQRVFHAEVGQWVVPRRARETPAQAPSSDEGQYRSKVSNRLVGVALSGGGIRSATFSLGVLQRLARLGILQFADYLSTVSGGGYLGASWSSLTAPQAGTVTREHEGATPKEADQTSPYGSRPGNFPFKFIGNEDDPDRQIFDRESPAVRHLRAHGNWLAPHLGLLDVWTWVATLRYVTSAAINLLLLPLPWLVGIMGLTMTLVSPGWWDRQRPWDSPVGLFMVMAPLVALLVFVLFLWWRSPGDAHPGAEFKHPLYWLQKSALVVAVLVLFLDLFVLGIALLYNLYGAQPVLDARAVGLSLASLLGSVAALFRLLPRGGKGEGPAGVGGALKTIATLLFGVAGYVALGVLLLLIYYALDSWFFPDPQVRSPLPLGLVAMVLGAWAVVIAMLFMPVRWFLNAFSLQLLYRRALAKAYVLRPATAREKARGRGDVAPRESRRLLLKELKRGDSPPDMPYHLIGASLNTSGDSQLERLGRRSDGMVFAHLYSGSRITGYRPTATSYAFKNLPLEEAMAISGASLSPNMGRATSATLAVLLTLFNIRIGSWIPNPNEEKRRLLSWRPVIWYWLKELFGAASAEDRYIYVTDGGHFDNSGLYELFKRRCKYIIAVDDSLDRSSVANLATAAQLARIDLGVQIDIDLTPLQPNPATTPPRSRQPFVVGRIKYPPVKGDAQPTEGVLVFITTVLTEGQKPDVFHYAQTNPAFPDQSTADQLFDQDQFESYRQLGHSAVGVAFPDALTEREPMARSRLERVFEEMLAQAERR